jgi:hypothetical protein
MPSLTIISNEARLQGFRYFWLKRVNGFDPALHCARCLKGSYFSEIGTGMPVNQAVNIEADPGDVLYLCGVSSPYRWDRNFHLALRVEHGAAVRTGCYTGDVISILGADYLPFDEAEARRQFPQLSEAYLSCRNFQFGAHHFRE